jgi:uncharacterized membrane protein
MGALGAHSLANAWQVLVLFLIPIGGGIPAGVLLAKSKGIAWSLTTVLYFVSDIILAGIFDPVMHLLIAAGKKSPALSRVNDALKQSTQKSIESFGTHLGPITLVAIAFGVDPMTGRAATAFAGHGFLTGWALAITGDMFYFALIMASTLWLNGILGDGTLTTIIIMVLMMAVPGMIRKARERWRGRALA